MRDYTTDYIAGVLSDHDAARATMRRAELKEKKTLMSKKQPTTGDITNPQRRRKSTGHQPTIKKSGHLEHFKDRISNESGSSKTALRNGRGKAIMEDSARRIVNTDHLSEHLGSLTPKKKYPNTSRLRKKGEGKRDPG
eukprot:scaffold2923_cov121-Cylindrotheca_fusiformis.AAC.8